MNAFFRQIRWRAFSVGAGVVAAIAFAAGLSISQHEPLDGRTLPPPYSDGGDDVFFFAPSHKFKLWSEAEAQALYRDQQQERREARP